MNTMLRALSSKGLIKPSDADPQSTLEADELRKKHQAMVPQTVEEFMAQRYPFLNRVKWLIDEIEDSPASLDAVIVAARKHLAGGDAGKALASQLEELRAGTITITLIKARWPKIYGSK